MENKGLRRILILSGRAAISDEVAKSEGLKRGEYRHVVDARDILGVRGSTILVHWSARERLDYPALMARARAAELEIKRVE